MGLLDYWRQRRGTRVYQNIAQHWLERDSSLPEGGLPGSDGDNEGLPKQPPDPMEGRTRRQRLRRSKAATEQDSLELHVPTRHILILAAAIVIFLVTNVSPRRGDS